MDGVDSLTSLEETMIWFVVMNFREAEVVKSLVNIVALFNVEDEGAELLLLALLLETAVGEALDVRGRSQHLNLLPSEQSLHTPFQLQSLRS